MNMINYLADAPTWLQIFFTMCASVGLFFIVRYWKLVLTISLGAIAIFTKLKGEE